MRQRDLTGRSINWLGTYEHGADQLLQVLERRKQWQVQPKKRSSRFLRKLADDVRNPPTSFSSAAVHSVCLAAQDRLSIFHMTRILSFPGTPQHQALLRAIVAFYEQDARVLAVIVFGSLGRGEWDALSDIDLDVVVADEAPIQVVDELHRLCASFAPLGECAALIVPTGDDEADVVLESLMQLSVRYHPLAGTKPAIVDSMQVLTGRLDAATIAAAAAANPTDPEPSPDHLLAACVRYAAVAQVYQQRASLWLAIDILHRMRSLLMQIFVRTHGGGRPLHRFPASAPAGLQARLGATLPQADASSLRAALAALIDLLENELAVISNAQLALTAGQQTVLRQVRLRLGHSS